MIKAVLFDVDGVLIDTFDGNRKTFNYMLKKLGSRPISIKEYRKFYFRPARDIFKYRFPDKTNQDIEETMGKFLSVIQGFFKYDKLYPEVRETLEILKKDFRLGIVTNRRTPSILDFFKIKDFFDTIVCLPDVKNHKPHPEPINLAIKRLGVKPEEAIYVGDNLSDYQAGNQAGMKVIIYRNPSVKGDFNIKDFGEILKIVERLNKA